MAAGATITCWGTTRTSRMARSSGDDGKLAVMPAWA